MEWTGVWADLPESRRDQLRQIAEAWDMDEAALAGRVLSTFARRASGEPNGRTSFEHATPVFPHSAAEIDLSPDENGVDR